MIAVVIVFVIALVIGTPIFAVLGLTGLTHVATMGVDAYFNIVT